MAFAQMKPGELLRESERAMGDAHLQTLHEELTAERKELLNYERVRTHCLLAFLLRMHGFAHPLVSDSGASKNLLPPQPHASHMQLLLIWPLCTQRYVCLQHPSAIGLATAG